MKKYFLLIIIPCIIFFSCSVDYRVREKKDIQLNKNVYNQLEGEFISQSSLKDFLDRFIKDTLHFKGFKIKVTPISEKKINIKYINQDTIFLNYMLRGKFKKGYFKVRPKFTIAWLFGPLLWGLREENRSIGITKNKDLVIINSGGGTGFVLLLPFFASDSQFDWEFKRTK